MKIAGVILAGGKGRRMDGANKALLMLGDKPFVTRVFERLAPQVEVIGINANRDLESFLNIEFKLPIVSDGIGGSFGPLDGILGAMLFAENNQCTHALTVSVDTPFLPMDLAEKLSEKAGNQIAIACSNGRTHGTCGLWPITQIARLDAFILAGKSLKVMDFLNETGFMEVPFEGTNPDPFFNINTPDDLAAATLWLSQSQKIRKTKMAKIAFLGLGVMGYPMAAHLKNKGGHDVVVYNRTTSKAEKWVKQHGGSFAITPALAVQDADFVFSCVGNDDDLRAVTVGKDGAFAAMKPGAVYIDNTTASADVARELKSKATKLGLGFIDAPVSGGQAGAENGMLTVMCGGDEATFAKAKPVIESFAKMVGLMGEAGAGQLTKMVNQICIAGLVQGLSEGIHFAKRAGLDVEKVVNVISKGAAGSWQMENRHKTMNIGKFDFGFAVDWMRKDLGIVLNEADNNGASLPITALVDQFYKELQSMGGNRWDTSSLIARLEK